MSKNLEGDGCGQSEGSYPDILQATVKKSHDKPQSA
jgi:hypothetical protein